MQNIKITGPSADPGKRVPWSRQLTEEEFKSSTIKNIFGNWNPVP
jgi:pectinesterase